MSLQQSVFPDQLKTAQVVPLHKKNSILEKGNYRPVFVLPNISKDLVLSHLGLAFVLMLRPFFPELVMSTDLLSFEHPSVLLFCF